MADRKRILLVEDDEFTRFMMTEIISTTNVGVDVAEDGQDGFDRLDRFPDKYALVLMDIHMPKVSGVDATRKIRSSRNDPPQRLPIIAVTADEKYHDRTVAQRHGMDDFIAKPIIAGDLLGLVQKYC